MAGANLAADYVAELNLLLNAVLPNEYLAFRIASPEERLNMNQLGCYPDPLNTHHILSSVVEGWAATHGKIAAPLAKLPPHQVLAAAATCSRLCQHGCPRCFYQGNWRGCDSHRYAEKWAEGCMQCIPGFNITNM